MLPSKRATEVVKERGVQYGHPLPIYNRAATMWSGIIGEVVTPQEVALCMMALKIARQCERPLSDNLTDICGYANVYEMMEEVEVEHEDSSAD